MRYFSRLYSAIIWSCAIIGIFAVIFADNAAAQTASAAATENRSSVIRDKLSDFHQDPFGDSSLQNKMSPASIAKKSFSYILDGGSVHISFAALPINKRHDKITASDKNQQMDIFYGLIELDLKPGRKTYWRNPGMSGFPPKIELSNGAKTEILYPVPQFFEEDGEWVYAYKNHLALPFRIILPQPIQSAYSGSLLIGICDKICMPQKIAFRFAPALIKQDQNNSGKAKFYTAIAALPKTADKNFGVIRAQMIKNSIEFRLVLPNGTKPAETTLYLDGGDTQFGLAKLQTMPAYEAQYSQNSKKRPNAKEIVRYRAPLLFGTVEKGTEIYYVISLTDGRAVSGTVKVSKP